MQSNKIIEITSAHQVLNDLAQLTKFRLTVSVVISSLAGYFLAIDHADYFTLFLLILGGFFMVGASNAFNQVFEIDFDKLMLRTQNRPLPDGRMNSNSALFIGAALTIAFLASISIFLYACVYTPLKQKTPLSVFVGAFPGAIPFMLGWVAATNEFGVEPGVLFMLQFFWQFPHFWAIGWLMHEQYEAAGFKMLPSGSKDQNTAFQIVFYTIWTIVISLIPAFKYTGDLYLTYQAAILIMLFGGVFLFYSVNLMLSKTDKAAKMLIRVSIIYITGVQLVYIIDKYLIQ